MILMWLGSFFLMVTGLLLIQKHGARFFSGFQKSIADKGFSLSTAGLLLEVTSVSVTEFSPQRAMYSGLGFLNLRILSRRPAVLLMCLSPLAVWPVLGLGVLFLNFSGYFILGLCALTLLRFWQNSLDEVFQLLFGIGLFLIGGENLLRQAGVVHSTVGQADLAFFMADGRFGPVLTLTVVCFLLSFIIQREFWTLLLSLALLVSGVVSFNGALGMLLGERLAVGFLLCWRSRSLDKECRALGTQYAGIVLAGALLGFWAAGEFRAFMDLGFSTDLTGAQEKSLQLVMSFMVMLLPQFLLGMVWGHFAGNKKPDEVQEAHYFGSSWIRRELLSEGLKSWAKDKVHKRLSEIRYHLAGISSLKDKVPETLQTRLKEEERQLAQLSF